MSRIIVGIGSLGAKMTTSPQWIWQQEDWPNFYWNAHQLEPLLRKIRLLQGIIVGRTGAISSDRTNEAALGTLVQNIIASCAIEGEKLNIPSVRTSLAKRIGIHLTENATISMRSEGLAQMMLDAIGDLESPLSLDRLLQWHRWLFPQEKHSLYRVNPGQLRGEEVMQVVSGRIDKPVVHFEAPLREQLDRELAVFIDWFNHSFNNPTIDPLLRAAICHFWFVTIHPFEDGNGRITRALTDRALAQSDQQSILLYAMSTNILANRDDYYLILEKSQRNTLDITDWLYWFMEILQHSMQMAINKMDRTLAKSRFWQNFQEMEFFKEQIKVLNRMFDEGDEGFPGGLSATQYKKITKVSKATATRHLADLVDKGCIERLSGGGRSTRYGLKLG